MSDEDGLEDFEPDQDDLEREDDDKETEVGGLQEGGRGSEGCENLETEGSGLKGWGWAGKASLSQLPPAVDIHTPHRGHDEGRAFSALQDGPMDWLMLKSSWRLKTGVFMKGPGGPRLWDLVSFLTLHHGCFG